ncbi:MAG: glycosyltransferase [Bacteroidota bacterium]|nr:glycosyltransferase [Bacteroidota bacterium]
MDKKLIIVSGMHRSGTSALTKFFVDLGFDAGNNLIPANEDNLLGNWEDWDIFNLNERIISQLFLTWDEIENFDERRIEIFLEEIQQIYSAKAFEILQKKFSRSNNIVIKDPRFCILMPFWFHVFKKIDANLSFYHIYRDPLSVAKSLEKRSGKTIKNGLLLWHFYNVSFLKSVEQPVHIISYNQLLNKTKDTLNQIENSTGFSFGEKDISQTIDLKLEHHKTNEAEIRKQTTFLPVIENVLDFLNQHSGKTINTKEKNDISNFLVSDLTTLYENEKDKKFNVSLVWIGEVKNTNIKTIQTKYSDGLCSFVFGTEDEQPQLNEFKIYFGDKPCRITLKNVVLNNNNSASGLVPDSGNYLFTQNNQYLFADNQPHFYFKLSETTKIKTIEVKLQINSINRKDVENIIPALNFRFQQNRKEYNEKEKQNRILNEKTTSLENERDDLMDKTSELVLKNEQYKNETEEYQDQIFKLKSKIISIEKKSRWLYDENNTLKASLSWKITLPLRILQKVLRKTGYLIFVLFNDIKVGYCIMRRDGISGFLYRLMWYIRGKRLKEDIAMSNQNSNYIDNNKIDTAKPISFPQEDNPLVSIIIPVFNQFPSTYRCIDSIKRYTTDIDFEIIIIDDFSTDKTIEIKQVFTGVNIIRNNENIGFLRSCNKAAAQAKGKYIHLLNNDTSVHPGWLMPLVNLMESSEKIGVVGSKLVYPDGKLQEAGGIIWDDASGWNYGKFDNPENSEYNYVKEVDYVSGASLMVRKDLWQKLGGFDKKFIPAYFEDTDFAFKVRELGYNVMYQPFSVISHFEGLSNGKSEQKGIKKHQVENQYKFLQKWEQTLNVIASPNGKNVFFHRDRSLQKMHILVIDHYVPHFDQDAGSRSTFNYIKLFLKMGFQVHFIGDNFYRHQPYTKVLQELGVEVLYGDYYQKNIFAWLRENGNNFDFVIAHRMHIAPKYLDTIEKYSSAKIAYVGHDLQFISSLRKYEFSGDINHKKESSKFKIIETKIFKTVDIIFPFSSYEAPFIKEIVPEKIVKTIPVFFYDKIPEIKTGFHERKDLLYVGFFGHPPNVDAALWFSKDIFPLIKKMIPDINLNIVGSNPTDKIKQLQNESITITGYVSDEKLLEYYQKSRVAVLPLRFGAGVKGKLLESLYHQIPTVITTVAAEGVPEIENYTLITDNVQEFAEKTKLIYTNEKMWEKYSAGGKELIKKYYTEEAARRLMEEVFEVHK